MADGHDTGFLHPAERELIQLDPKLRLNPVRSADNNFGSKSEWTVEQMEQNVLLTTFEKMTDWAAANSVWPAIFGLACCAIEMMSVVSPRYDLARFGAEVFRASPRQADLMVVSGRVAQKMAPALRQIYDQMLEPKWVIAMGACASSGGMFANYSVVQGVHKVIPVDIHVPGCPPRPEQLMHGFMQLQKKIKSGVPAAYEQEVGLRDAHVAEADVRKVDGE